MSEQKTRLIALNFVAYTRCDYREVIEVPVDLTQEQLDEVLNARYQTVDGGDYVDDPHYWQRGEQTIEAPNEDDDSPKNRAVITDGKVKIEPL